MNKFGGKMNNIDNRYVDFHVKLFNKGKKAIEQSPSGGKGRGPAPKFRPSQYMLLLAPKAYDFEYSLFEDQLGKSLHVPELMRLYLQLDGLLFSEVAGRFENIVKQQGTKLISNMLNGIGAYKYHIGKTPSVVSEPLGEKKDYIKIIEELKAEEIYDRLNGLIKPGFTKRHFIENIIFPMREGEFLGFIDSDEVYLRHVTDGDEALVIRFPKHGKDTYSLELPATKLEMINRKNHNDFKAYLEELGLTQERVMQGKFVNKEVPLNWKDEVRKVMENSGISDPYEYYSRYGLAFHPSQLMDLRDGADPSKITIFYKGPQGEPVKMTIDKQNMHMGFFFNGNNMTSEDLSKYLVDSFYHKIKKPSTLFQTTPDWFQQKVDKECSLEHTLAAA